MGTRDRREARAVTYKGSTYKLRGTVEVPDFSTMESIEVRLWICRHTYARGYHRPNPLVGMAGAVKVVSR
jgi:hypothetical protein